MADIRIDTNTPIKQADADISVNSKEIFEKKVEEADKNSGILTSTAIENSKIEADTLTTGVKEDTPQVTEDMLDKLNEQLEEAKMPSSPVEKLIQEKINPDKSEKDTVKAGIEHLEKKKVEKELEKAEKEAKEEQTVAIENRKLAQTQNKTKTSKGQNIKVKIVKVEGKWKALKPNTPEYNNRNTHMQNVKSEYFQKFPEPPVSADGSEKGSESAEHAKWNSDYKKHMKEQEISYQQSHQDYKEQYQAYKKAQRTAEKMNKK